MVPEGKRSESILSTLIGNSAPMKEVLRVALQVAPTEATVLLLGESGTGKDLLARVVHEHSPRWEGPFVKVDCTALPEGLLESELFGHEKGAFTDAHAQKLGRFELAQGGTLFLDEIGETSLALQAKLLRVLQEKSFERLGGTHTLTVDTRIIASTNRNLEEALKQNRFREDLYFRLNVIPIRLPTLRERREDVPTLARHFLERYARRYEKGITEIRPAALDLLCRYSWPGNVRELEHAIERAILLCDGSVLEADDIPVDLLNLSSLTGDEREWMSLEELEKEYIRRVLRKVRGHKSRAAQVLGINRKTLLEKRKRYELM